MTKSVFSLPINPKLDKQFTDGIFIPWLTKYKPYIKVYLAICHGKKDSAFDMPDL